MNRPILERNFILAVIICLTVFSLGIAHTDGKNVSDKNELVIFNWSDYIDPDLVTEFEKKLNAKVKQVYYETDETRDDMLLQTDGVGYDVVLASASALPPYIKQDWLVPIDASNIPNLKYVDSKWLNAHPQTKGYFVPYLWGTVGIAYRQDLLSESIISWKQLYQPKENLRKKIVMIYDSRDTIGHALKALGYSLNSNDPKQHREVEQLLISQRPYVKEYSYIALDEESALVKGDILMTMMYNGDALTVKEHNSAIAYVVPKEGSLLWVDGLVVMKTSKKQALAMKFINFLNEPKNAARLAEYLYYATPNAAAERLLSKEHLTNPLIYPSKEVLARCEIYKNPLPRILKKRNEIFSMLTN